IWLFLSNFFEGTNNLYYGDNMERNDLCYSMIDRRLEEDIGGVLHMGSKDSIMTRMTSIISIGHSNVNVEDVVVFYDAQSTLNEVDAANSVNNILQDSDQEFSTVII
ncbi:hypothetical protein ACJX0J_005849, partial [Zea mays]